MVKNRRGYFWEKIVPIHFNLYISCLNFCTVSTWATLLGISWSLRRSTAETKRSRSAQKSWKSSKYNSCRSDAQVEVQMQHFGSDSVPNYFNLMVHFCLRFFTIKKNAIDDSYLFGIGDFCVDEELLMPASNERTNNGHSMGIRQVQVKTWWM